MLEEKQIDVDWKRALLLFALLIWSFSWFAGEFWNWNSVSRLFSTISIVDSGTTRIDPYAEHTGDKAMVDGHYYCDKAPGMTLLALPAVGAVKGLANLADIELSILDKQGKMRQAQYGAIALAATISTSVVFSALASLCMVWCLIRLTGCKHSAFYATLTTWLGTPLWGWSGSFFGHAGAAAFLTFGFFSLFKMLKAERKGLWTTLAGMTLTTAVVVEFTAAPAAFLIFLWGLWKTRTWQRWRLVSLILLGAAGTFAALVPFMFYNWVSFGKLIAAGYGHVVGFEGMQEGFMGLTYPKPKVMFELLFGLSPGLLLVSPVLWFVPFGWQKMKTTARAELVLSLLIFLYYLLLNSSYHYWGGAWTLGPRHMTACLPFLALPLAFVFRDFSGALRKVLLVLTALSVLLSVASASAGMAPGPSEGWPFWELVLKPFLTGSFETPLGIFLKMNGYVYFGIYCLLALPMAWRLTRETL